MRTLSALFCALFLCSLAQAEDVEPRTKLPSSALRLRGASSIVPVPWGYVNLGGSTLKHLPNGKTEWETLYKMPGLNLYRMDADDKGRLLVSWERDPDFHLFIIKTKQHFTFPKPKAPSPEFRFFDLDDIYFSKEGDAIVYMHGLVDNALWGTAAFYYPLDGKRKPTLLFSQPGNSFLTEPDLAAFAYCNDPHLPCSDIGCRPVGGVVAYEIKGNRALKKILWTAPEPEKWDMARIVGYSDTKRIAVLLFGQPEKYLRNDRYILRWSPGEDRVDFRFLPKGPRWNAEFSLLARNGDLVEGWNTEDFSFLLERRTPEGKMVSSNLIPRNKKFDWDTRIYMFRERPNGDYLLHLGNHLFLIPVKGPMRAMNVEPLLKRRNEWAGADIYIKEPEAIWMGIEVGGGRDFVYQSFADFEKKAKIFRPVPAPVKDR
jgi:hypothetical protein